MGTTYRQCRLIPAEHTIRLVAIGRVPNISLFAHALQPIDSALFCLFAHIRIVHSSFQTGCYALGVLVSLTKVLVNQVGTRRTKETHTYQ